ncbi:MAG: diacylglycerol kinase [Burkholderiales bacterium]|nr:MAG: diacylglycerol kinase [Burkholderiales bacterium]
MSDSDPSPDTDPDTDPPAPPLFVVMNAGSGSTDAEARRAAMKAVFDAADQPYELMVVADPSMLSAQARRAVSLARAAGGTVVAAGGDGTINAVAQQVLGSGCPLGILPQGTFNYFGRTHGIPTDIEAAARVLLRARPRPIRVGLVNDRIFLVNASVGLYPELLQDREAWKRRFGRNRFVAMLAALATVLRGYRPLRLELDSGGASGIVRTPTLFVGNNPLQLARIGLPVDTTVGDGRLAAIVVPPLGPMGLVGLALRGAFGDLGGADTLLRLDVEQLTVRASRLRRRRRMDVATDGEVAPLAMPLRFRVAPEPLLLRVPDADDPDRAPLEHGASG